MATPPSSSTEFPPGYLEVNYGGRVIAACATILVMTTILFAMRLAARSLSTAKRGWDDHVLIPAYLCVVGLATTLILDVHWAGLGRHTASVAMEDPNKVQTFLFLLYTLDWFYFPANMLTRLSVVILYLRIFPGKWVRVACWSVMAFLIVNCVGNIISAQVECMPLAYAWDKSIPGGKCFDLLLWYKLANFPNIAADVCIFILPIRTVWHLNTSFSQKVGISAVCFTGSIGIIASSYRTSVFFLQADVIMNDPTFCYEAFAWTIIESGLYFSAACLIGLRPLLVHIGNFFKGRFSRQAPDVEKAIGPDSDVDRLNRAEKIMDGMNDMNDISEMGNSLDMEDEFRNMPAELPTSEVHCTPRDFVGGHYEHQYDGRIYVETSVEIVHARGRMLL